MVTSDELRRKLEAWMVQTNDPMLGVFQRRDDAAFREAYVQERERESDERRATGDQLHKSRYVKPTSTSSCRPAVIW